MSGPQHRASNLISRYQRIATTMYTLADHPGMRWASGRSVTGATLDVARDLQTRNDQTWARFNELRHWCDKLSEQTDPEALQPLLATRIALDSAGLPIRYGNRADAAAIGLEELADGLHEQTTTLLSDIRELDSACGKVADQVAEVTSMLGAVELSAAEHGMAENHELVRLRDRIRPVVNAMLNDPLGSTGDEIQSLRGDLAIFADSIGRLERIRVDHPERLAELRGLVTELTDAERTTMDTCALAASKIANPVPRQLQPQAAALSDRVTAAQGLAANQNWHILLQQLDQLKTETTQALRASRDLAVTAQTLLDRRSELRGRFAAYARKAARLGVIETAEVEQALGRARHLLQLAPCDLPAATRALSTFQETITTASTREDS